MTGVYLHTVVRSRDVEIEFDAAEGEVIAVLGANGAGKSTALAVIAGLLRPDIGVVRCGDTVLTDTEAGVFVPAHARRVGLLLQEALLFPHLSVLDNVAFGPRSRGRGRAAARDIAGQWLERVDAVALAERAPRELSGGQAQRVAIARALAADPDVLLLDEPLAGLDVAGAASVRTLLRTILAREHRAAVLITHDLLDVLTLADRVVVLDGGRVVEQGPATRVLTAPRSAFAAQIAGVNLVSGVVDPDGALVAADGTVWYSTGESGGEVLPAGTAAVAVFDPAAVAVFRDPPQGSPRNTVAVTIDDMVVRGSAVRVRAARTPGETPDEAPGLAADVTAAAAAELSLCVGQRVYFAVKAHALAVHRL